MTRSEIEEEESRSIHKQISSLEDVPKIFFESPSPESCILTILSELPPIFDESFDAALAQKIALAEESATVVIEHLTNDVLSSQNSIFDATDTFLSLNDNIVESSDFIHSIRDQVSTVRQKTLNPILSVLTMIRDIRRDTKALTVLHFVRNLALIYDALNSTNLVWAAYTLLQAQYMLLQEKAIYSLNLFESFIGFTFKALPNTKISPSFTIKLTISELKKAKCIKNIVSDILSFTPQLMSKMDHQLCEITQNDNLLVVDKYSVIVVSYCLIADEPPIARVLFDNSSKQIRSKSFAYFETNSNDLQTLFKFMENSCSIISNFKQFIEFHESHSTFGSIVSELPIDIDVVLLEKLPPDKMMQEKMQFLINHFNTYYSQLTHVAESNVLQFLSRLNCTTLDALSFIRLTRALKEFSRFLLNCNGLTDWIKITASDFMAKYTSASNTSIRHAVQSDSWVPTLTDVDFIELVQTMPSSSEKVFSDDQKKFENYASTSSITTVRVIHSLICLSLELDVTDCFNLIVQVAIYFITCVMNSFSGGLNLIEGNDLNPKIGRLFDLLFTEGCRMMFKLLTIGNSLPDQTRSTERNEAQLMQMITATDGLALLLWYLSGIRENMTKRSTNGCIERVNRFFASVVDIVLPNFRRNVSVLTIRNFLQIKNLKYQIVNTNWVMNEVTIEYHPFVVLAKKALENLGKQFAGMQLKRTVIKELWDGAWSHLAHVLISSFAAVKNCNSFGRSLMAADTRAVAGFFLAVTKNEADTSRVLGYVNAFFYQVNEFAQWIDTTPAMYKQNHVVNLIKTGLNCKLSANETKTLISKTEAKFAANARF